MLPTCFRDIYVVTPIMVKGRAEVPGVAGVGGLCATEGKIFVHQYPGFWGRHWSGIEVVESIEEGVGEKFWVEARVVE